MPLQRLLRSVRVFVGRSDETEEHRRVEPGGPDPAPGRRVAVTYMLVGAIVGASFGFADGVVVGGLLFGVAIGASVFLIRVADHRKAARERRGAEPPP